MRTALKYLTIISLPVAFAACNRSPDHESANTMDSTGARAAVSAAPAGAPEATATPLSSPERKVIKTADFRCRVKDVFITTAHVEGLVNALGGEVSQSHMDNQTEYTHTLPYTADSVKQLQAYTTTAHLSLKIPVAMLDSVLANIAAQSAFINTRNLHLEDVTLQYLSNKLKNEATQSDAANAKATALARKTGDAITAGNYAQAQEDSRIDRKISNLSMLSQAAYATLDIDIYQPERIDILVIANTEVLMKPTFRQQLADSFKDGWKMLQYLFVGMLTIWPALLVAVIILFLMRRRLRKAVLVAELPKV